MNSQQTKVVVLAAIGALCFGVSQVKGVEPMVPFYDGDPVSAANFNTNFDRLFAAVEALESQVSDLEDQLAAAEASIGHVELPNGDRVPLFRKVLAGTKDATETIELPHGLTGLAGQRRLIGCEVVSNYATNGQTISLNLTTGSGSAAWCDVDNTNVTIQFSTNTAIPNGGSFFAVLDYVEEPVE